MGKKRKAGRSGAGGSRDQAEDREDISSSKYDPGETFADAQDEFFAGKDQILLDEGPSRKRRKQIEEEDRYLEPSDEEVLGYSEDEDELIDPAANDTDSADNDRSEVEDEDGVQDWGTSKADYYDADIIETEADALEEEAEARRLQQKQLQSMTDADFGLDESEWGQAEDEQTAGRGTVVQKLPEVVVTEATPIVERLKILKSRYPELEPLARDYTGLQDVYEELQTAAKVDLANQKQPSQKRKAGQKVPVAPLSIAVLKWRALSSYLGSIAMYFALFTAPASAKSMSAAPMPPSELRQHPVMQSLLRSRQSWDAVKDLTLPQIQDVEEDSEEPPEEIPTRLQAANTQKPALEPELEIIKQEKKAKRSKQKDKIVEKRSNKTGRSSKDPSASKVLTQLDNLIASVRQPTKPSHTNNPSLSDSASDFGDEAPLTESEALSKAARKKGLRFYTSQLAQKSNKRNAASQHAGGDADLPYKERLRDRQERLMREAENRGKGAVGERERLGGGYQDDSDEEEQETGLERERKLKIQREGDGDEDEDYYQTITSQSRAKKADKASRAAAANAPVERFVDDPSDPAAKRAITYEISANKGLMPRRKKEVRNPRVKKRMKYDEKMKKLGSVRQVYKGGEAKGGYGGELTGIKTNVVRSVKL